MKPLTEIAHELHEMGFGVWNTGSRVFVSLTSRPVCKEEIITALDLDTDDAELGVFQSGYEVIVISNVE